MQPTCFFVATTWNDMSVSRQFLRLANELSARGHRVVVVVDRRRCDVADPTANPAVYTWPSPRPTGVSDARFLWSLIGEYRPSCLIANFGATNLMTVLGAMRRVPQRVCWYHTLSTQIDIDAQSSRYRIAWQRRRKGLVYRMATWIVPASHAARDDVQRTFGVPFRKTRVFHNTIADPMSGPAPSEHDVEPNLLVCPGRLYPTKGQDVLIRAMALLKRSNPAARVEFVGAGPSAPAYARLVADLGVADTCRFAGVLSPAAVLERIRRAEATVVPSRSDNCPLVTIESLAVGTPLVASAVGGIPEIVREGTDGYLVRPDDPEALAGKLQLLLANRAARSAMRRNARERFLSQFEQTRAIDRQVRWLERISGAR